MKEKTDKSVLSQLREMPVGDQLEFPISRRSYIKSVIYNFSIEWGTRFSGKTNLDDKTFIVTRVA